MVITIRNNIVMYIITYSIAITSLFRDDGITAGGNTAKRLADEYYNISFAFSSF